LLAFSPAVQHSVRIVGTTAAGQTVRYARSAPYSQAKTIKAVRYFCRGDFGNTNGGVNPVASGAVGVTITLQVCKIQATSTPVNIVSIPYCSQGSSTILATTNTWVTAASGLSIPLPNDSYIGIKVETVGTNTGSADYNANFNFEVELQ
jgi:hypothetical protein